MKKVFECSNGITFFINGMSIIGTLPKEEATDFVSDVAIQAIQAGDKIAAHAALLLLQAINKSYIHLSKAIEIEIIIVV